MFCKYRATQVQCASQIHHASPPKYIISNVEIEAILIAVEESLQYICSCLEKNVYSLTAEHYNVGSYNLIQYQSIQIALFSKQYAFLLFRVASAYECCLLS